MRTFLFLVTFTMSLNVFAWGVMGELEGKVMSGAHTDSKSGALSQGTGYSIGKTQGWSWNNTQVHGYVSGNSAGVKTNTDGGTFDAAFSRGNGFGFSESSQMGWSDGAAEFQRRFMR